MTALVDALRRVNGVRMGLAGPTPDVEETEAELERLYRASRNLAVYGSLAPGRKNHDHVRQLRGSWSQGSVRGRLFEMGWGAAIGYPAMEWDPQGDRIPVSLLVSDDLAAHWDRLDRFEGSDYARILVSVEAESKIVAVANIYAVRHSGCRA